MIEYVVKFLQLSRLGYTSSDWGKEGKKVKMRSELSYSDHDELFRHSRFLPVGR